MKYDIGLLIGTVLHLKICHSSYKSVTMQGIGEEDILSENLNLTNFVCTVLLYVDPVYITMFLIQTYKVSHV